MELSGSAQADRQVSAAQAPQPAQDASPTCTEEQETGDDAPTPQAGLETAASMSSSDVECISDHHLCDEEREEMHRLGEEFAALLDRRQVRSHSKAHSNQNLPEPVLGIHLSGLIEVSPELSNGNNNELSREWRISHITSLVQNNSAANGRQHSSQKRIACTSMGAWKCCQ